MFTRDYEDQLGRKFKVLVKDENDDPAYGHILGPPFLDELELPEEIMVRLHNELFARNIITKKDARRRLSDIVGALMSALKVDATKIAELYDV